MSVFTSFNALKVGAFAVGIFVIKQYMQGGVCKSKTRLDGKVAIITGANTGIGKLNAEDFITRGAKVYMACRSIERGEAAASSIKDRTKVHSDRLVVMKLDLGSLASVRKFSEEFHKKEDKLDLLINNAGVMWTNYNKTEDGFEEQFGVNHLGHFLLTNLLLDMLKAAAPSRVVTVSSLGHESGEMYFNDLMWEKKAYSCMQAYSQSKLANILFTKELAKQLSGTGVTTYAVHPGAVSDTELGRHLAIAHIPILSSLSRAFVWIFSKDSWHGAQTQICCAVSEDLALETGKYYSDCAEKLPSLNAQNMEDAARLWTISEELVGIKSR